MRPVDRLAHVVDRERGDRAGGERLHLDAGAVDGLDLGLDLDVGRPRCGSSRAPSPTSSGWHSGIRSGVRLAAWMPATRATASTSPLVIGAPGDQRRGLGLHVAPGSGRRPGGGVGSLGVTSTMRARPSGSRWVRPRSDMAGESRRQGRPRCRSAADLAHASGRGGRTCTWPIGGPAHFAPTHGRDGVGQVVVGAAGRAGAPAGRSRRGRTGRCGAGPRR